MIITNPNSTDALHASVAEGKRILEREPFVYINIVPTSKGILYYTQFREPGKGENISKKGEKFSLSEKRKKIGKEGKKRKRI